MLTLYAYGAVGDTVLASTLVPQIAAAAGQPIELHISSQGGDVQDGIAIATAVRTHGNVHAIVDAFACSIASLIAISAKRTSMAPDAVLMVHNPSTWAGGTAEDLQRGIAALDAVTDTLVRAYIERTGASEKTVRGWMAAETWFTATQAVEAGFANDITEVPAQPIAASIDLSRFTNVPKAVQERMMSITNTAVADGIKQERARVAAITASFGAHPGHEDIMSECITAGATIEDANARLLQAIATRQNAQPIGRPVHVVDRLPEFQAAATDVIAMRMGVRIDKPHPAARDLARMRMVDIAEATLRMQGVSASGWTPTRIINAAFTLGRSNFTQILMDALGKSLLQGYQDEPDSGAGWTLPVPVSDFRTQYRVQLGELSDLAVVPEHAEYTFADMTEGTTESYALATYGKLFNISRQALVNDDLRAFDRIPTAFGQAARRLELDKIMAILTSNPTMGDSVALFHSSHANLAASGTALSVTSLAAGRAAMRKQKGAAGLQTLNLAPRYLIVPAALETVAEQLIASMVDPSKSNDTANLEFIRGLELRVDARLDANSATAWYLAASPAQVGTVERAYLDGMSGVQIEQVDLHNVDGTSFKVRHDFACAAVDYRGLYKNPGA